jgi:hypothetical protein
MIVPASAACIAAALTGAAPVPVSAAKAKAHIEGAAFANNAVKINFFTISAPKKKFPPHRYTFEERRRKQHKMLCPSFLINGPDLYEKPRRNLFQRGF